MIGKILGFILGFKMAGWLGGLFGLWLGHQFDRGLRQHLRGGASRQAAQTLFFDITFQVMGHLAKADGRVNEQEIATARAIMAQMGLSEEQKLHAMHQFNMGKQNEFNLIAQMAKFDKMFAVVWPMRQLFLEIQLQAAYADGQVSLGERKILEKIARMLRFSLGRLAEMETRFKAEQSFSQQQHHYSSRHTAPRHDPLDAYALLGIDKDASPSAIKKAYRKQMSQHHPDKLVSKGLPPDMLRMATEKAQAIQQAYDQIREARGLK